MLIHRLCQVAHSTPEAIHNLKKFSVLLLLKFTPAVQKELEGKILSGY